jgi:putative transposase
MLCRYRHNVHLLRNSFRYAGRQHWQDIAKALKPVYTAPTEARRQATVHRVR